jgi:hypothetical protein
MLADLDQQFLVSRSVAKVLLKFKVSFRQLWRLSQQMAMADNRQRAGMAVRVSSTSNRTAAVDPIVLRETSTTRLVFCPTLLDNPANPEAPMDGKFLYERKTPSGNWHEFTELPLSKLKAEEWVKIDLRAVELLALFEGLESYYSLVREHGLTQGTQRFIRAPRSRVLRELLANESQLRDVLQDEDAISTLLGGLITWISSNERAVAAARLDGISLEDLQQFDAVLGLARLQRFCRELDENAQNSDEGYWQNTFNLNGWVIAQLYAVPFMLIQSQVYVGGKLVTNRMGNTADFLFENEISGNVVLVENKTPATPLLGDPYRNNVFTISEDVSGGLVQILNARQSLIQNYATLATDEMASRRPLSPRGLLVIGSTEQLHDHSRKSSFELFRSNQREIDIVTFDELRRKAELLVNLIQNVSK